MAVAQRMTADEYLAGPEHPRRTELVEGGRLSWVKDGTPRATLLAHATV